jgi:hypothetical protein
MIACISAAESSEAETKNTLNYAVRARNIKNKVSTISVFFAYFIKFFCTIFY